MRVLAIHYYAPPMQAVPAIRLHAILKRWRLHTPIWLLTSSVINQFPIDEALALTDIYTEEIPTRDWRSRIAVRLPYQDASKKSNWWHKHLASAYHAFPFILFTGDGGRTYIREGIHKASIIVEREGITHLFSSYRPWADHLICYQLKKKYPHLIWVADFRDRAADPIRGDVWWPWLQRQFQRYLLRKADIVTAVSEGQAQHFREDHQNVVVVRNGMKQMPTNFLNAPASSHFTIAYTGSLYPRLQTAQLLFKTLRQLIDEEEINPAHLELHYAGKDGSIWSNWLADTGIAYLSKQHGMISLAEAETLQRNSQVNLLLSWSAEGYGGIMTAKLASYLSAGRPIIALLNGPPDPELTDAIEQTGAGIVLPLSEKEAAQRLHSFLLDAYRTWAFSGALPWQSNSEKLQPYSWDFQIQSLLKALPS